MLTGLLEGNLGLRADFNVKVTAKDGDIYLPKDSSFEKGLVNTTDTVQRNNRLPDNCVRTETTSTNLGVVKGEGVGAFYVLPKGKTAFFKTSFSCKTNDLFRGSYYGQLAQMAYSTSNPETWPANSWQGIYKNLNFRTTKSIVVVGEKGPWIKTATVGAGETGFLYNLQGERFTKDSIVYVDGQRYADISSNNMTISASYTGLYFGTSQLSSGYHNVYVQNKIGKSNTVTLQVGDIIPTNQLPIIYSITASVVPGGRVEIQGERLTRTDYGRLVVVKGSSYDPYPIISSPDGKKLSFQVDSRETPGTYDVYVQTPAGVSNSVSLNVVGPEGSPKITSATANVRADNNSTVDVTIRGEKFADIGNIVKIGTLTRTVGILQVGSEFLLSLSIPRSQMPDGNYPVTVEVSGKGVSNAVTLQVGSVAAQPSVTVTSPNGGETYKQDDTINVRWNVSNTSGLKLQFDLLGENGALSDNLASGVDPKLGSSVDSSGALFAWTPFSSSGCCGRRMTVPGNYRIRASLVNTATGLVVVSDRSDNPFTIVASATVTPEVNLVKNPDFSAGQANWNFIKVVPNVSRSFIGNYSTNNSGEIIYQTVLTKPGTTYEYGAKVKSNLTSGVCQVDVFGSGVDTDVVNSYGVQNKSWSDTFVARGASVQIRMINTAIVPATTGSVACSYDDLYLKPVTTTAKATTINQLASALASLKALIQALR